jgi:hypothetical protein
VYWSLSLPSQGCTGSGSVTWQATKN